MRVFFSAGEASGDAYAAAIAEEMRLVAVGRGDPLLKADIRSLEAEAKRIERPLDDFLSDFYSVELPPDASGWPIERLGQALAADPVGKAESWGRLHFEGIGGKRLADVGGQIVVDSSTWGAISILQALKVTPRVMAGVRHAQKSLTRGIPGLFIPIDFGYVNIKLARFAKKRGWKVLYFSPPGGWRKNKQGKDLPAVTDEIVTPFPWSAEILNRMGASAHFFGHPLRQMIRMSREPGESDNRQMVAVLPGSRMHEIGENLPVIAEAVKATPAGVQPVRYTLGVPLEFAVASSIDPAALRAKWQKLTGRTYDFFTVGDTYGVLSRAKAAIVCSGTATLEAALCRCPMVVMYRFGRSTAVEVRLRTAIKGRPKFISLPNILLDREVVPELIQEKATPITLRAHLDELIDVGEARMAQLSAFREIEEQLGPDDAITKTAELALRMMGG